MKREEFLQQLWRPYPLCPKGANFNGRLQELHFTKDRWQVQLENQEARTLPSLHLVDDANVNPLQVLQAGDLVSISEKGMVSLLAPRLAPLPSRRYRPEILQLWQEYLRWVREFFRERNFVEITTPSLVPCPGTEPTLDVFSTEFVHGRRRETLYLPTSPELHLKKALALGAERIFEIKNCFRNGEITPHHQPEFTMIEWYRAYHELPSLQQDVRDLIHYLHQKMPVLQTPTEVIRRSVAELFIKNCDFELRPETSQAELEALARRWNMQVPTGASIDDLFFLLFLEKIESQLPSEALCFIENYPPYQAALARLTPDGWGDRFEVYWQGLEIANAFHELNDPRVQRERFQQDLAKKKAMGKDPIPLDKEFLQCLDAGMPPSAGIALGLERLFMALSGVAQIADLRLFPLRD